jgi:hypothetical protein
MLRGTLGEHRDTADTVNSTPQNPSEFQQRGQLMWAPANAGAHIKPPDYCLFSVPTKATKAVHPVGVTMRCPPSMSFESGTPTSACWKATSTQTAAHRAPQDGEAAFEPS